jgi:hypothetical protein
MWGNNNEALLVPPGLPKSSNYTIVHRVMSRVMYRKGGKGEILPVHEVASQYDIAESLGEAVLYNNDVIDETRLRRIVHEQTRLGRRNAHQILYQEQFTVNLTVFSKKAERLIDSYQDFTPSDCALLPT